MKFFWKGTRSRTGKLLMPRWGFAHVGRFCRQGPAKTSSLCRSPSTTNASSKPAPTREAAGGRKSRKLKETAARDQGAASDSAACTSSRQSDLSGHGGRNGRPEPNADPVDASLVSSASSEPAWRQADRAPGSTAILQSRHGVLGHPRRCRGPLGAPRPRHGEQELLTRGGEIIDFWMSRQPAWPSRYKTRAALGRAGRGGAQAFRRRTAPARARRSARHRAHLRVPEEKTDRTRLTTRTRS